MSVVKLVTVNFRNLISDNIDLHNDLNFIVGNNGSGKSSILEALFYLGHGKSFRTNKVDSLACYNKNKFVVSIKNESNCQLGLSREIESGQSRIKINGVFHKRLSDLAKHIAIQIVTPESFKLFFGGPRERRRFVDLGMFHVKHSFANQWKDFNRILKHRNACIKKSYFGDNNDMFLYWSEQFCKMSIEVSNIRKDYCLKLITELDVWLNLLLPDLNKRVSVQYHQGWPNAKKLMEVLFNNKDRELKYGYSLYGAHKFDIKFLLDGQPLEYSLSRGQQKLFLLALTFAQSKMIASVNRVKPILLIDDIGAELDENSRQVLSLALEKLNCQVIITAIDIGVLKPFYNRFKNEDETVNAIQDLNSKTKNVGNYKVFHVEHGKITTMYSEESELKKETAIE